MITIEIVDEAWANFDNFKETAEQHDFLELFMLDCKLTPAYNDLHVNWSEEHASIFMKWMKQVSERFGFKCPAF